MNVKWSPVSVLMENAETPLAVLNADVTVDLPLILKRGTVQILMNAASLLIFVAKASVSILLGTSNVNVLKAMKVDL